MVATAKIKGTYSSRIAGIMYVAPKVKKVDIATIGKSNKVPVKLKTAIRATFIKEMVDIGMGSVISHNVSLSVEPAFLDLKENSKAKKNTTKTA